MMTTFTHNHAAETKHFYKVTIHLTSTDKNNILRTNQTAVSEQLSSANTQQIFTIVAPHNDCQSYHISELHLQLLPSVPRGTGAQNKIEGKPLIADTQRAFAMTYDLWPIVQQVTQLRRRSVEGPEFRNERERDLLPGVAVTSAGASADCRQRERRGQVYYYQCFVLCNGIRTLTTVWCKLFIVRSTSKPRRVRDWTNGACASRFCCLRFRGIVNYYLYH
jgi:hypothetical protein